MKRFSFPQNFAEAERQDTDWPSLSFSDQWEELGEETAPPNNWLLSYIDILTLFLTLFAVLLALQPKSDAQPLEVNAGEYRLVTLETDTAAAVLPTPILSAEPDTATAPASADLPVTGAHNLSMAQPLMTAIDEVEFDLPLLGVPIVEDPGLVDSALPADPSDEGVTAADVVSASDPLAEAVDSPVMQAAEQGETDQLEAFVAKLAQRQLDERVVVSRLAEGVYFEVRDNILFAQGSAELKREGAILLDDLAQLFLDQNGVISVEGHTDDRPIATARFPSNWELSSSRATTVTRHLIDKGLDPSRLRAVGYADTRPLESNTTPLGRARNRRVALIVEIPES